ncbi:hypothetical protein ACFL3I_13690 [Pseudomonadota bacterium]
MNIGFHHIRSISCGFGKAGVALFSVLVFLTVTANTAHAVDCIPSLYGASYDGKYDPAIFKSINITNGISIHIGPTGFNRISTMDVDPTSGILYAVAERHSGSAPDIEIKKVLISIDRRTGAGTQIAELSFGDDLEHEHIAGMSFDSSGTLYGYGSWDQGFYTIDVLAGTIERIALNNLKAYGNALAFSPDDILYHVGDEFLNTVNLTSGLPTKVFESELVFNFLVDPNGIPAMDYGPETGLYYAVVKNGKDGETELATIDVTTGVLEKVGDTSDNLDGLVYICDIPDVVFKDGFESP